MLRGRFSLLLLVAAVLGGMPLLAASAADSAKPAERASNEVRLDLPDMDRPATLPAESHASVRVLRTPGYKGGRKVPATRTPAPPAPIILGKGRLPSVVVDAAGTSHIVWNEEVTGPGVDVTHYCRLPRGAKACNNPNGTPMPITPPYSGDYSGPKILQIGDQLVVLTHRYPAVVTHPDGQTDDDTVYAWTSVDGGTTWGGPAIVGNLPLHNIALVGGATPRIAAITDAFTEGLMLQTIDAGSYTRTRTRLDADTGALYEGQVAADGDGVVVAASAPVGPVLVRRVGNASSAGNPAAWSSTQIPGTDPVLAGGPSGPFLVTRTGNVPTMWRVDGGGVPQRIARVGTGSAEPVALAQDATGNLHASWLAGAPSVLTTRKVRPDGSADAAYPVAIGQIDEVASSAAFDGGGIVAYRRTPSGGGESEVAVGPFGPLSPTGQRGAGSLFGTGIPGGFAGCKSAGFEKVAITPRTGCLLPSTDPKFAGSFVSRGSVDFNGLTLIPDAGVSIMINPGKRTLDTSGRVTIALEGPGIGTIPLAKLELHLRLSGRNGTSLFSGVDLPRGALIKGFPIDTDFDVIIDGQGVRIPLSLRLPPALGGVSGSVTLRAKRVVGAQIESFKLGANQIPLGPVSIRNLRVSYTTAGDRWSGAGTLQFVTGGLTLSTEFAGGRFVSGRFAVDLPPPGVMVFSQVWLTQVRGGLSVSPRLAVTAGVNLGIIYLPAVKGYSGTVTGDLTMTVRGGTLEFAADGTAAVGGLAVGRGRAVVDTIGRVKVRATTNINLEAVNITGEAAGFFDGPTKTWGLSSESTVRALGVTISRVAFAASAKGLGVCGTASPPLPPIPTLDGGLKPAHIQVGYTWGARLPDVSVSTSCSIETYRQAAPAHVAETFGRARSHAVVPGDRIVSVTQRRTVNVIVQGAGGVPDVDVLDPAEAVVTSGQITRYPLGPDRALIVIAAPRTGTWIIRPRPGSVGITDLRYASELAPVKATGRITGPAKSRVLRYTVSAPAGTTVELREVWKDGGRRVAAATARRSGVVRLPVDGRGGMRTVVAVALRGGIPQQTFNLAKYRAPLASRLAAPRGIVVSPANVRWRPVTGATRYVVLADLASGRRVAVTAPRTRHSVRVPGASGRVPVRRVQVTAVDGLQRLGRTGTAVARKKAK